MDTPTIPYAIYKEGQLQKPEVSDTEYYKVVKNDGGKSYGRYPVVLELLEPEKYTWETTDDKQLTVFFFIYITNSYSREIILLSLQYSITYVLISIANPNIILERFPKFHNK